MKPNEIKAALVLRGITITALAKKIGVDRSEVGNTVHGRLRSKRAREGIAAAIDKPVSEVFPDDTGKKIPSPVQSLGV